VLVRCAMIPHTSKIKFGLAAALLASPLAVSAASSLLYGPSFPVVDGADIASYNYGASSSGHYTDNTGGAFKGQTFSTGVGFGSGFALNSFMFDTYDGGSDTQPISIVIGTITNGTFTPLLSDMVVPNARSGGNGRLTYTLDTPLILPESSLVGAAIRGDGGTYVGLGRIDESTYTGGSFFSLNGTTVSADVGKELVFHFDMSPVTAIPEPANCTLLIGLTVVMSSVLRRRSRP
jgi:hypothetical protein